MFDVFHHIPDVELFLKEAVRCLKPGGRILIVDGYLGWISRPIFKWIHHEPYSPETKDWKFESQGPLSDANTALAWVVFERDRSRFERLFPQFKIASTTPHSPLRYWIAGGLKRWSLTPSASFGLMTRLDQLLVKITPQFVSFVDIEIEKIK